MNVLGEFCKVLRDIIKEHSDGKSRRALEPTCQLIR